MANSTVSIKFPILKVTLLHLVAVEDDAGDTMWDVGATFELAVNCSVHMLDFLKLNLLVIKVVVLVQVGLLNYLFHC